MEAAGERRNMELIQLQRLVGGALQKNTQKTLEEVFQNIQDPNTPWKNKREVTIKLKFIPNENRDDCSCEISVDKKLAPVKPLSTKFAIGRAHPYEYTDQPVRVYKNRYRPYVSQDACACSKSRKSQAVFHAGQ